MQQLSIDDATLFYHKQNEYSREANQSLRSSKSKLRAQVLAYIGSQGAWGATSDECEAELGMTHQTCSARFVELKALDLIVPTGMKRPTRGGRNAGAWRAI